MYKSNHKSMATYIRQKMLSNNLEIESQVARSLNPTLPPSGSPILRTPWSYIIGAMEALSRVWNYLCPFSSSSVSVFVHFAPWIRSRNEGRTVNSAYFYCRRSYRAYKHKQKQSSNTVCESESENTYIYTGKISFSISVSVLATSVIAILSQVLSKLLSI